MTLEKIKKIIIENKAEINKYGIKTIGIFGSTVNGGSKPNSDIDILVEFNEKEKNYDNYMELKFYLQKKLRKKNIDLVMKKALKKRLRNKILKEVEYA
jgi:uncharacterized protein